MREVEDRGEESWFQEWFGEEYLALYPHRDGDEARDGVELLLRKVAIAPEDRVLDLACGAGRHLRALVEQGIHALGLDLSEVLLGRTHLALPGAPVVRGDMRHLPYGDDTLSVVASFFTSFGYFQEEDDDARVVEEVHRVLQPGGYFLLDFLHAGPVRSGLPFHDEDHAEGMHVRQDRRLVDGGRVVEKQITIQRKGEPRLEFQERVRLYEPEELAGMLESAGLPPQSTFGAYDGSALKADSPRCILLGRKQ
ncbi:MAG: class I SAM-dependent methyltransferase [Gemmatimonadota bacterium]